MQPAPQPSSQPAGASVAPPVVTAQAEAPDAPAAPPTAPVRASQAPASAAALRWLEGAFAGLRAELQSLRGHVNQQHTLIAELVSGITQQQVMLSELVDARDDDFRLIQFAEALPQLVSDAVAAEVRDDRERTVREIVSAVEEKLEASRQDLGSRDPEETATELRAFLQNDPSTRSIVAAVATQAAARAMRAEVAEQLPKVLEEAVADARARMDEVSGRMEKLVAKAMRAARSAPVPAPPAEPATTKPARATRVAKPDTTGPAVTKKASTRVTPAKRATIKARTTKAASPAQATKATPARATKSSVSPARRAKPAAPPSGKKATKPRAASRQGANSAPAGEAKAKARTSPKVTKVRPTRASARPGSRSPA